MISINKAEEILRNNDPRFIDWHTVCIAGGLTEDLIREYIDFLHVTNWMEICLYLGLDLSENFIREFKLEYMFSE